MEKTELELKERIECSHKIISENLSKNNMKENSIGLIITSPPPPYLTIKENENATKQKVGFKESLNRYIASLTDIFDECAKTLVTGGRMCINISDRLVTTATNEPSEVSQIIPLHSMLIESILKKSRELVYLGSINWEQETEFSGGNGGKIITTGSYPKSSEILIERDYIIILRKLGKAPIPSKTQKMMSRLTLEEWRTFFRDNWKIRPDNDQKTYPVEIPLRLIKMYSFIEETMLDPFLSTGIITLAASMLGRNSMGYKTKIDSVNKTDWEENIKKRCNIKTHTIQIPLDKENKKTHQLKITNTYEYR